MSNISFSKIVTAEAKAQKAATVRAQAVKEECRRRILRVIPFEAQQNIAQAMAVHAAEIAHGASKPEAKLVSGLETSDFLTAQNGRQWIASMQATCRAIADNPTADPTDDAAWPAPPELLVALVARF